MVPPGNETDRSSKKTSKNHHWLKYLQKETRLVRPTSELGLNLTSYSLLHFLERRFL